MKELSFKENELIVSKTDSKGRITYGNDLFIKLSGYTEVELLGAPHNIIRHKEMPKLIFKVLWDTIQSGKEINAYVINLAKNGDYYWVYANVTPSYDSKGNIIGYYSVRRKPTEDALNIIKPIYKKLVDAEKVGGISKSEAVLKEMLALVGGRYDKYIISL